MKIECTVDGKELTLSLNSNKPLSLILEENLDISSLTTHCRGKMCGLCAVLVDGRAELSCMVPAFEIRNKKIVTFDYFQKTKEMKDIARAYEIVGVEPCQNCYASRSIVFESIISSGETRKREIKRILSGVRCSCMESDNEVKIVMEALKLRRKRNVRRS